MRNLLVAVAVAGALALAAAPQIRAQDDLATLKSQIEALQHKVEELEKQQQAQQEAQDRATDVMAQQKASTGEWVGRFTWKGDLRYRHENIDQEGAVSDQTRHRIRARFGFTAKVNDNVTGTMQLATNGGSDDPRSTNQTLGEGWTRKGVAIDLAYLDWKAMDGLTLQLGKMPQAWVKAGSYFWDSDLTPEGGALKFARGSFFANAVAHWLSQRTATDATLLGAQLGFKTDLGAARLTGAIGYFDVGAVQGEITTAATGCDANPAFFGGPQGNTTVPAGMCATLASDFNMIEALMQAELKLGSQPLTLFADVIRNQEVDDLDTGTAFGVTVGKASNPGTWEFGYVWQKTQKDAQFGQFVDADFGGGVTDVDGSVLKLGYAPAKNWVLNGAYLKNKRGIDVGTGIDYDRYQIDLNYRF